MKTKKVSIPIDKGESVSGILSMPEGRSKKSRTGIIIAHGAGGDMNSPLIVYFAEGLSTSGYTSLRFNFLYKEKGRKAPDHAKKLNLVWGKVYQYLMEDAGIQIDRILVAGKSMGGRVASQLVSDGSLGAAGIFLLGYPLHPPGKKDKLRDAHLYDINVPMLFFAGTRDTLCDLDLMNRVYKKLTGDARLQVIEGGDHSFKFLKSANVDEGVVYKGMLEKAIEWLDEISF